MRTTPPKRNPAPYRAAMASAALLFLLAACGGVPGGGGSSPDGTIAEALAVAGDSQVAVSWSPNGDLSTSTITISMSPATESFSGITVSGGSVGYLVTGLDNGTEYTFTLTSRYAGEDTSQKQVAATPEANPPMQVERYAAGTNDAILLDPRKGIITLTGVQGKHISYANINPGDASIADSAKRRLAYAVEGTASGASASIRSAARTADGGGLGTPRTDGTPIRHFIPPRRVSVQGAAARAGSSGVATDTFRKDSPRVGQTKTMWIDANASISQFRQAQMTLRAIGKKDGSIVCLVWSDGNYSESACGGRTVNSAICEGIAEIFAENHAEEERIFGTPSDKLIPYGGKPGGATTDMADGDTGTWVNIVIYDIGNDYRSSSPSGVVGYFFSKDYYQKDSRYPQAAEEAQYISNGGKYFYIDAPFCNYTGSSYNGTGSVSKTVISTLFHEYQHMLSFGNKDMKGVDTDCNEGFLEGHCFNEMLSMLAEDLMTDPLGLHGSADYVAAARLPSLNGYYYASGALEYRDDDYAVLSYSTAYGLGSYVARNYGGATLIQKMCANDAYGRACITQAIQATTGRSVPFDDLLCEYVQACVFRTAYAQAHDKPTHNVVAASDGSALTLHPIDIYEYDKYSAGPRFLPLSAGIALRPTGFQIYSVGTADTDTVTLWFTPKSAADTVYVYVQDAF